MNNKFINFFDHNRVLSLLVIVFALLLVAVFVISFFNKYGDKKEKVIDDVKITDVKITKEKELYNFEATLTPTKKKKISSVDIIFYDDNKKEIVKVNNIVNQEVNKDQSIIISAVTDANIKAAKDIKYNINE